MHFGKAGSRGVAAKTLKYPMEFEGSKTHLAFQTQIFVRIATAVLEQKSESALDMIAVL